MAVERRYTNYRNQNTRVLTSLFFQTIIECLKYATTGEQPPNTRGGAFVHDPKMAAEKEVKAQVKLRFKAANGNTMLVTRSLSVTLKKSAGMTMKTLEAILTAIPRDGINEGKVRATRLPQLVPS